MRGDNSGLKPTPEFEAMIAGILERVAGEVTEAAKSTIYRRFAETNYATMFAIGFIEDQARMPCPHGGAEDKCECYPHRARRWLDSHTKPSDR